MDGQILMGHINADDIVDVRNKLRALAVVSHGIQSDLENSDIGQAFFKQNQDLCQALEAIRQGGNLDTMIMAEAALIVVDVNMALSRNPQQADKLQSFDRAQEQMTKGLKSYDLLTKDIDLYKLVMDSQAHHPKQARERYPYDSFRSFADSHIARIKNDHRGADSDAKRLVLEVREANMKAIRKLYKDLQEKELPEITRNPKNLEDYLSKRYADIKAQRRQKG